MEGNCQFCHSNEWANFCCEKCDRGVCVHCFALSACQTSWCLCRDCYDYKCRKCGEELSREYQYLNDTPELEDLCEKCYEHRCRICNIKMTRKEASELFWGDVCAVCEKNPLVSESP